MSDGACAVGSSTSNMNTREIEAEFRIVLPQALSKCWTEALSGGANSLRLLMGPRGVADLTGIADFVEREQRDLGALRSQAQPFSVLPFAEGDGDSDYVVLLPGETDGVGEFRVREFLHDCDGAGQMFPSFAEWAREVGPIRNCRAILERAAREDLAAYEALRDRADESFDGWCREVLRAHNALPDADSILREVMEHFWEHGNPY